MFQFKYFHIPTTLSREYCSRVLQALEKNIKKPQIGNVHLIAIDSDHMARMNEQFRGKEGPTDILTFSFREEGKRLKVKGKRMDFLSGTQNGKLPSRASGYELAEYKTENLVAGEIYLCLEKIKFYAKERGVTYKEQLEYIIIHGMVHLMGYDHETDDDWQDMERVEKKIHEAL